jgi:acetylornithine deacetylase/succinyl-diaminopimelate desuccinylase-like protein
MMVAAFLRAKEEDAVPPGGLVLCVLSDEEHGGDFGAKFLADEHADALAGVRHALGEVGGFTLHVGGLRVYPIQVAEKQMCQLRATLRGPGGHAARPMRGGAMARLGQMLDALDRERTPIHVTDLARQMFEPIADALPASEGLALRALLDPATTDAALAQLGEAGLRYEATLRNTVNATIVHGGSAVNVIPSEIVVDLDGRALPGFGPDDMLAEVGAIVGDDVELQVMRFDGGPAAPDMGFFDGLADTLRKLDPEGIPVPMLMPAVTDGRHLSPLGIQTYGFMPLSFTPDFPFDRLAHAADERVPVDAVRFGADAMFRAVARYPG